MRIFWFSCLFVLLLDQLVKEIIILRKPNVYTALLTIHQIENTGAGFGILPHATLLLATVSVLVAGITIYYGYALKLSTMQLMWTGIFLGGVLGNMLDRILRGYVIDFIDFKVWPVFNLADTAISIAAIVLLIYSIQES